MFYNTGIATYIWVLSNRKPEHRQGKVQLIDATGWYQPLRKNLGKKNCELGEQDIQRITETFLSFEESEQSKIFDNAAFGYWKVTVERPLRLTGADPDRTYKAAEIKKLKETGERSETAPPVIRKIHRRGAEADRCEGCSPLPSRENPPWWSTSRIRICETPSKIPAAGGGWDRRLSAGVRSCPMHADAWYIARQRDGSATKSASPATSTSRTPMRNLEEIPSRHPGAWRRRPKDCSARSWVR